MWAEDNKLNVDLHPTITPYVHLTYFMTVSQWKESLTDGQEMFGADHQMQAF